MTARLARLTATQLDGILNSTSQLLAMLDDDPLILGGGRNCESRFEHVLVIADRTLTGLALGDPEGRLVCSSPRAHGRVVLAERLLKRLQAGETFAVGEAATGPITGTASSTVSAATSVDPPGASPPSSSSLATRVMPNAAPNEIAQHATTTRATRRPVT